MSPYNVLIQLCLELFIIISRWCSNRTENLANFYVITQSIYERYHINDDDDSWVLVLLLPHIFNHTHTLQSHLISSTIRSWFIMRLLDVMSMLIYSSWHALAPSHTLLLNTLRYTSDEPANEHKMTHNLIFWVFLLS